VSAPSAPESLERPKQGGHATGTLNHLVGPGPLKEYVDAVLEEEQLLDRLGRVIHDRSRHELVLRLAGVSREQLEQALRDGLQSKQSAAAGR
jgi:DNA-binding phage protein